MNIYDEFIPERLQTDALTYSHAKNIVVSGMIAVVATPVYAFLYYYLNFPLAAYMILIEGAIVIGKLFLFRWNGHLVFTATLFSFSIFALIVWLSYHLNGIYSPTIYWLVLPPMLSILFGQIRVGYLFCFFSVMTIVTLFIVETLQIPLPASPITNPLLLQSFSIIGLVIIIVCLAYFFEMGKREANHEIHEYNTQLKVAIKVAENLAEKADKVNRLKTTFMTNVSHELRTPLNGIIGFAEILRDEADDNNKEYIGNIVLCSKQLLHLVDDILHILEIESGDIKLHPEQLDVKNILKQVNNILQPTISSKNIKYENYIDPNLKQIIIDQKKFNQILYNFVSNAIKFTPNNGEVTVRVLDEDEKYFKVEVVDTGIGISPTNIDQLFVEFQQVDTSATREHSGLGLGLALTRKIVEILGGTVGVTSELGKGSTFYAVLPYNYELNLVRVRQEIH